MPARFQAAQDRALLAIERVRGEAFLLKPQVSPTGDVNARRTADPTRPELTFTGVFTGPHASTFPDSADGHASSRAPRTSAGKPQVALRKATLPYPAQQHDRIVRVETSEVFSVSQVADDGEGRLVLSLNG